MLVLTLGAMKAAAPVGPPPNSPPDILASGVVGPLPTVTVSGTSTEIPYFIIGNPAPTCSIDNGVGSIPCSVNGNQTTVTVSPVVTTTYTLTATNSYGTVTAQATVVVLPLPANPPGPGLLTPLPRKTFKQALLPPQYHYTFANIPGFVPTHSGDLGVPPTNRR